MQPDCDIEPLRIWRGNNTLIYVWGMADKKRYRSPLPLITSKGCWLKWHLYFVSPSPSTLTAFRLSCSLLGFGQSVSQFDVKGNQKMCNPISNDTQVCINALDEIRLLTNAKIGESTVDAVKRSVHDHLETIHVALNTLKAAQEAGTRLLAACTSNCGATHNELVKLQAELKAGRPYSR